MSKRVIWVLGAVALAACYQPAAATEVPCSVTYECPGVQVCDRGRSPPTCVGVIADARTDGPRPIDAALACVTSIGCPAQAPTCDLTTHVCRPCRADAECSAAVCNELNGICIADANVVFVSQLGDDANPCDRSSPCATLTTALSLVTQTKRTIRVGDGAYNESIRVQASTGGASTSILFSGEDDNPVGATLSFTTGLGPMVQVESPAKVVFEGVRMANCNHEAIINKGDATLYRVEVAANTNAGIRHVPNNQGLLRVLESRVINNKQVGIEVQQGNVEISSTLISGNVGGGASIQRTDTTSILNSMVVRNGTANSSLGGLWLQQNTAVTFSFNTVANNAIALGPTRSAGVESDLALAIDDSILTNNGVAPQIQMSNACTATYSLFSGPVPSGAGNRAGSPDFVDVTTGNFHILSTSAARSGGNPSATAALDYDGDHRPLGAGFDIGADEIP